MRAVLFNGSPKGAASNTEVMLGALAAGLRSGGAETDILRLAEKRIAHCLGCYACWTRTPGRCAQEDDMAGLIETMAGADLLVFGSPLYFNNVSGTLKAFFDRLTAAGGDPHKASSTGGTAAPKLVMVSNSGFPRGDQFAVLSLWIGRVAATLRCALAAELYTGGGRTLTQPAEGQAAARGRYLAYLEACGRSLATEGRLSDVLAADADRDLAEF